MKFILGIICGVLLGLLIGLFAFSNSEAVVSEVLSAAPKYVANCDDKNALNPQTFTPDNVEDTVSNDPADLALACKPLLEAALKTKEEKPIIAEADLPHPIFGDNETDTDVIEAKLQKEAHDDNWNFYLNPKITEFFQQNSLDGAYKQHSLDCRTSACKLNVTFKMASRDPKEMMKLHMHMSKLGIIGPRATSYSNCDEKFECSLTEYFSRDPVNDPYMTAIPWRRRSKGP